MTEHATGDSLSHPQEQLFDKVRLQPSTQLLSDTSARLLADETGEFACIKSAPGEKSPAPLVNATQEKLLDEVQRELRAHDQASASRGYISKVADAIYRRDDRSLNNLKGIEQSLRNGSLTTRDHLEISKAIEEDQIALNQQNTISGVTSTIAKTAPLFMKGSVGWVGTIAANALEQAKPGDALGTQLIDGVMGATKGAALKGTFAALPDMVPSYAKGTLLGAASRFIEIGLDRHTYIDSTGNLDITAGLINTAKTSFNPKTMAVDAATFAVAGGAVRGVNYMTRDLITKSPFLSTITTGSVYGFSTGATSELIRQHQNNEGLSVSKVLGAGASAALISGVASIPGAIQAQSALNGERAKHLQERLEADKTRVHQLETIHTTEKTGRVTLDGRLLDTGLPTELARPGYSSTKITRGENGKYTLTPGLDTNTTVNGKAIAGPRVLKKGDVIKTTTYSPAHEDSLVHTIKWNPKPDGRVPGLSNKPFTTYNLGEAVWEPTFVRMDNGKIELTAGSRTNTKVNGIPIEPGQQVEVKPGDKITTRADGKTPQTHEWGQVPIQTVQRPQAWMLDAAGDRRNLKSINTGENSGSRPIEIMTDSKGISIQDAGFFKFFAADRMRLNGRPFLPSEKVYIDPYKDVITNNGKPWQFFIDPGKPQQLFPSSPRTHWDTRRRSVLGLQDW